MSAHTSGPLTVIASASGKPLIIADHPRHEGDIARMARDTPEAWATARLFSAAPDLLAALLKIQRAYADNPSLQMERLVWMEACMPEVDAAIAKATRGEG